MDVFIILPHFKKFTTNNCGQAYMGWTDEICMKNFNRTLVLAEEQAHDLIFWAKVVELELGFIVDNLEYTMIEKWLV